MKGFNNDICRRTARAKLVALCGLVCGLLAHIPVANAQSVAAPDAAFQRFMWTTTGANSQSVTVGTGGVPIASPTGSGTIAADGSKSLAYNRNATWRNPSGNTVSGGIGGKIPINAKTAKLLTAGMKLVPFLGTGAALWEMATELGYDPLKEPDGSVTVRKKDPTVCSVAPCFNYSTLVPGGNTQTRSTAQLSCQAAAVEYARIQPGYGVVYGSNTETSCVVNRTAVGGSATFGINKVSTPPVSAVYTPSSLTELEDAIAAKSGWPSSSSLPKALVDSATATGQKIDIETPTVTGPATSPGTTKTTINTGTNTTTTTATTHNHVYNDNRVTNTITTSVNSTNNTTGTTTTETTTEQPVEEPAECEKNPSSLNCADLDTPQVEIPKTTKTITWAAENLGFGSGKCIDPLTINHQLGTTSINFASYCGMIETWVKPLVIAFSILAAFFIVAPVRTEE